VIVSISTTVAIIGAGPLGRKLAFAAARSGFRVILEDVMPANLRHAEEALREQLSEHRMPLVCFVNSVEDAVREADLVLDCVPDELESKLEIFCLLDRMAPPKTVLATPTTHLSIADLASCTYRPDRCVSIAVNAKTMEAEAGVPIPIRVTSQTSEETRALVAEFWERLGYVPLVEEDQAEKLLR
jgi:3-hydroxybutyryl-CoA dehydrogenase